MTPNIFTGAVKLCRIYSEITPFAIGAILTMLLQVLPLLAFCFQSIFRQFSPVDGACELSTAIKSLLQVPRLVMDRVVVLEAFFLLPSVHRIGKTLCRASTKLNTLALSLSSWGGSVTSLWRDKNNTDEEWRLSEKVVDHNTTGDVPALMDYDYRERTPLLRGQRSRKASSFTLFNSTFSVT